MRGVAGTAVSDWNAGSSLQRGAGKTNPLIPRRARFVNRSLVPGASAVTYANSLFVSAKAFGAICSSTDGLTWTQRGTIGGLPISIQYNSTAGLWIVGTRSDGSYACYTSPDGTTWTGRSGGMSSSNTARFTVQCSGQIVGCYGWNGSTTLAGRSDDGGITWSGPYGETSFDPLCAIYATANSRIVVGGASGVIYTASAPDGVHTARTSNVNGSIQALAQDGTTTVAVTSAGEITTSTSVTTTWTARTSPVSTSLGWIAKVNGIWFATGASGVLITSPDAVTWTKCYIPPSVGTVAQVVYANGVYATYAGAKIFTSRDGVSWAREYNPGRNLSGITTDGTKFVATGFTTVSGTVICGTV